MDSRVGWLMYEEKLLNDCNGFGLSIQLGVLPEGTPVGFPLTIEPGGIGYNLRVYDPRVKDCIDLLFVCFTDILFFMDAYLKRCHDLLGVETEYKNYCRCEDVIYNKKLLS